MTKIAHIFDDAIITTSTVELFKKIEGFEQTFFMLKQLKNSKFNHQTSSDQINWIDIGNAESELDKIIQENDIIYFQALSYEKAKSCIKKPYKNKVFIWGLWGYELYNVAAYFNADQQEYSTNVHVKKSFKEKLIDYYTFKYVYPKAIKKIDFAFFFLKHDFELLSSVIKHHAILHQGCYQTIENLFSGDTQLKSKGNDILIGNSSTPSNRHEFVFSKLTKISLENRKLVVPLSYGDEAYRKKIMEYGEKTFSENFESITNYMSLSEYTKLLSNCSVAILAHKRQQGFGTILMLLYGGVKVFLSEESPFYEWFNNNEIQVFSIENDLNQENLMALDVDTIEKTKQKLSNLLSENKTIDNLNQLLKKAETLYFQKNGKNLSTH